MLNGINVFKTGDRSIGRYWIGQSRPNDVCFRGNQLVLVLVLGASPDLAARDPMLMANSHTDSQDWSPISFVNICR